MKATHSLDLYLWKHFIPNLSASFFKVRVFSKLSLLYISLFPLPRKFIRQYFNGNGESLSVETKKIILNNIEVLEFLQKDISNSINLGKNENYLSIPQIIVTDPNYKYSLGSFSISYTIEEQMLRIKINSNYHFGLNLNRITRHLHNWLYTLKLNGKASDFDITGDTWLVSYSDLSSIKKASPINKFDFNRLYI